MTFSEKPWTARRIEALEDALWRYARAPKEQVSEGAEYIIASDPLEPIAAALYEALENILWLVETEHDYDCPQAVSARAALALANGEGA